MILLLKCSRYTKIYESILKICDVFFLSPLHRFIISIATIYPTVKTKWLGIHLRYLRASIIDFVSRASIELAHSARLFDCEQQGDYRLHLNPRGAIPRRIVEIAKRFSIHQREEERRRKKTQTACGQNGMVSSSLGLSREKRIHTGRCTYASGKVAIKILRKRYHTACRAGVAFILVWRIQCDC